jgi:hypothetical protein
VDQGEASLNQGDLGHSARARPGEAGHQKAKIEHTRGRTSSRTEEAEAAGKGVCGGIEQHEVATWGKNTRNEKLRSIVTGELLTSTREPFSLSS